MNDDDNYHCHEMIIAHSSFNVDLVHEITDQKRTGLVEWSCKCELDGWHKIELWCDVLLVDGDELERIGGPILLNNMEKDAMWVRLSVGKKKAINETVNRIWNEFEKMNEEKRSDMHMEWWPVCWKDKGDGK